MSSIGAELSRKRDAVIARFEEYEKLHQEEDGIDLDFLTERCNSVKKQKFQIAVVGEVKAGKSTLINALLRETLLPADVLQASSAIIEIKKSSDRKLTVTYADRSVASKAAENAIDLNHQLRKIGAVDSKFRDIPINLLDEHLIKTGGRERILSHEAILNIGRQANQNLEGKMPLLQEYLDTRQLKNIPVCIQLEYPLPFTFDDLCIIDSPGINAIGGIQDTTFNYLNQADAVLFVHSLILPIEQNSLRNFINTVVTRRSKESLFLLLSHAGSVSEFEREEKLLEAHRLYADTIDTDRILTVDSLMPRIAQDIQSNPEKSLKDVLKHYKDQEENANAAFQKTGETFWRNDSIEAGKRRKLLRDLQDEFEDMDFPNGFVSKLLERSRFPKMEQDVDKMGSRLPINNLKTIVNMIKIGLTNQLDNVSNDLALSEKSYQDPQGFKQRIEGETSALLELEATAFKILDDQEKSFDSYKTELEDIKQELLKLLTNTSKTKYLRKFTQEIYDISAKFIEHASNRFKSEAENKLANLSVTVSGCGQFKLPRMDFDSALAKATKNATREEKRETSTSVKNREENTAVGSGVGAAVGLGLAALATGPISLGLALLGLFSGGAAGAIAGNTSANKEYTNVEVVDEDQLDHSLRMSIQEHIAKLFQPSISGDGSDWIKEPVCLLDFLHNIRIEFRNVVTKEIDERCAARRKHLDDILEMSLENEKVGKYITDQRNRISRVENALENIRIVEENI